MLRFLYIAMLAGASLQSSQGNSLLVALQPFWNQGIQVRVGDEHHVQPPRFDPVQGAPMQGGQEHQAPPHRVPDFTDNMIQRLDPALVPNRHSWDRVLHIRTWYLHHDGLLHNEHPRHVQLFGDQSTWINQIRGAWVGVMDEQAPTAFSIASPPPPRAAAEEFIALDILVSQGLHNPRYSGLVTLNGDQPITSAHSFPRDVSGYMIVDAIDAHHLCAPITGRRCMILHGWNLVPVTVDRVHLMRSGHSFVIYVPPDPSIEPTGALMDLAPEQTVPPAQEHGDDSSEG